MSKMGGQGLHGTVALLVANASANSRRLRLCAMGWELGLRPGVRSRGSISVERNIATYGTCQTANGKMDNRLTDQPVNQEKSENGQTVEQQTPFGL